MLAVDTAVFILNIGWGTRDRKEFCQFKGSYFSDDLFDFVKGKIFFPNKNLL